MANHLKNFFYISSQIEARITFYTGFYLHYDPVRSKVEFSYLVGANPLKTFFVYSPCSIIA
jgi:hypothetical protein